MTVTIDSIEYKYNIYEDGSVVDINNVVVCMTGGQSCLDAYI